ncbi:MAG: cytochrome c oxidase subunit 4 [Vulcanimicrobiaceae bacterium]|jgi:hypothetical protein
MSVGVRLFLSSALFATVIAVVYWYLSREPAGTILLAVMAFGLSFAAGYMILAERDADLVGDRKHAAIDEETGVLVGTYSLHSPLPLWSALAITCTLLGLILSPALTAIGLIGGLTLGVFFILQSR